MKIVVINNYKEPLKAKQALDNLVKHTGRRLEMVDHKTPGLLDTLSQKKPDAAILTGSNFMLSKSDTRTVFQPEMDVVKKLDMPTLGICFGHQLIGAAFGSEILDLGQNIRSFQAVNLLCQDPIFDGLPETIQVAESHRQNVRDLPKGFRHLAESTTSKLEVMAHEELPIYGLQFHPERSDDKHPHGKTIIQNFVKLAARF